METELITLPNGDEIQISDLPLVIGKSVDTVEETEQKIRKALSAAKNAKEAANAAKGKSAGWSWDGSKKKEAIEALQKSSTNICEAQDAMTEAMTQFFEGQKKLSEAIKYLFGLGVVNMAANRTVVRELEKKLRDASKDELSDLARQEMLNVIQQLKAQEDLYNRIEKQKKEIIQLVGSLESLSTEVDKRFITERAANNERLGGIEGRTQELEQSINKVEYTLNGQIQILGDKQSKDKEELKHEMASIKSECVDILKQVDELKLDVLQNIEDLHSSFAEQKNEAKESLEHINEDMLDKATKIQNCTDNALALLQQEYKQSLSTLQEQHSIKLNEVEGNFKILLEKQKEYFEQEIQILRKKSVYNSNFFIALSMLISFISLIASIINFVQ